MPAMISGTSTTTCIEEKMSIRISPLQFDMSGLKIKTDKPLNAEPASGEDFIRHFITPESLSFRRNHSEFAFQCYQHHAVAFGVQDSLLNKFVGEPNLDVLGRRNQWRLPVQSLKTLVWGDATLEKAQFVAALQCAGNRRDEMSERRKTEGLGWGNQVVANAKWGGVTLRSVLLALGVPECFDCIPAMMNAHVLFNCSLPCQDDKSYESSVPLSVAMDRDRPIILCTEMNDAPLPVDRGGPVRLVIPGYIGARWVKWLERIEIVEKDSDNFYMTLDYKLVPSHVTGESKDEKRAWMSKIEPLTKFGLQAVICSPSGGSKIQVSSSSTNIIIEGYALTGSGNQISSVEVGIVTQDHPPSLCNLDNTGNLDSNERLQVREWCKATLRDDGGEKWAMKRWYIDLSLTIEDIGKELAFVCKAEESTGIKQPELCGWNLRGVENRSWSVIRNVKIASM